MTCKTSLIPILLLVLTGCATTGTQVPDVAKVPVPVPCISQKNLPARPEVCRFDQGMNFRLDAIRCKLIDRDDFVAYADKLEAAMKACIKDQAE